MNIYLIGMIVAMAIFVAIGFVVSRKVKSAEEFYVAGRQAPVILIAGSLVASYSSTGMFMGDAASSYDGAFISLMILAGLQSAGYIFGSIFFGRYLRRSKALTMPEFFAARFDSKAMRTVSAITAIVTMTVYMLSIIQGIGTMMELVTGVDYRICIVIAMVVFTIISVTSGSRGVLITDTLMAAVFTIATIIAVIFIAKYTGGWYDTIETLSGDPGTSAILSWAGRGGVMGSTYKGGLDNVMWGVAYGVVWMSVCMIGPWQASRFQMAKNERVVIKSSYIAAVGIFVMEFLTCIGAVMINRIYPDMNPSSHVLIWASMNIMPKILGVILLTGILAAGISSATTFQSLIGASVSNDIVKTLEIHEDISEEEHRKIDRRAINIGRIVMIAAAIIVTAIAIINPPAIFIIMMFGAAIIASSWMPVAVGSVFSKRLTRTGALCGMIAGFCGTFFLKLGAALASYDLPIYLEPSIVGIVISIIAMIIGSACTQVTDKEKEARERMFIIPEHEKDPVEAKRILKTAKRGILAGLIVFLIMLILWIIPYMIGAKNASALEIVIAACLGLWISGFALWGYIKLKRDYKDIVK